MIILRLALSIGLFLLLFCSITLPVLATTYHVDPNGSDSNSGAQVDPWRTLQHAADMALPGDTVYVHAGIYDEEVRFTGSGTDDSRITFSVTPDEAVTVTQLSLLPGVAFLNIQGFLVTGFSEWGVELYGNNHHVVLSRLTVIGGEAGVHMTCCGSGEQPEWGPVSDVTLEHSQILDPLYTAVDCTPGPCNGMVFRNLEISGAGLAGEDSFGADGIAVERGMDILVENCHIHDNGGDGIDLNSRDVSGNISGIVVRRNQVVRNHRNGIKLWSGGRMENNTVWGQGLDAIWIGDHTGTYEVLNNTVAYNMWDLSYSERSYSFVAAYPENGVSAAIDLTLINNIFAFNATPFPEGPTGIFLGAGVNLVSERNNLFWSREDGEIIAEFVTTRDEWFSRDEIRNGTWSAATGQGQGDITIDPSFVSGWPNVDLHLQPGSPAEGIGAFANTTSTASQSHTTFHEPRFFDATEAWIDKAA